MAIIGWVFAVPFLAGLWFVGGIGDDGTKSFERKARVACSARIESSLRNPASVEWDGMEKWPVLDDGDGLYTVIAKYRAANGFGGMVNETRQCLVARSDKTAAVLGVE